MTLRDPNRQGGVRPLRIAFLDENGNDEYHGLMAEGVFEAAAAHGAQVVRIGHFTANDTKRDPLQIHALHRYVAQFQLDGLLFTGWGRAVTLENEKLFRKAFADLPLFSVGRPFEGIPTAWFDGSPYMEELLHHLLQRHGCRRVAFIEPFTPDGRTDAYRRVMQRAGCMDDALLVGAALLAGLSVPERGRRAVEILLDERRVRPDAVVSLYNNETEGILKELAERGIRVPEDMAVTSYEDGELGRYGTPAYTTILFPWRELGRVSCDLFLSRLRRMREQVPAKSRADLSPEMPAPSVGASTPSAKSPTPSAGTSTLASVLGWAGLPGVALPMDVRVPGRFIVRESCGCLKQEVSSLPVMTAGQKTLLDMSEHEWLSLADLAEETLQHGTSSRLPDMRTLMKGFVRGLKTGNRALFLQAVEAQLDTLRATGDAGEPDSVMEMMRGVVLPHAGKMTTLLLAAEDMFLQATTLLTERSLRTWGERERVVRRVNHILEEAGSRIVSRRTLEGVLDAWAETLGALGIADCLVALVERAHGSEPPFSSCMQVFRMTNGIRVEAAPMMTGGAMEGSAMAGGAVEGSAVAGNAMRDMAAGGMMPSAMTEKRWLANQEAVSDVIERFIGADGASDAIMSNLLFTDKEFLGFVLYGRGPSDERAYRALSYHLSVALDGIHLNGTLRRSMERLAGNARQDREDSHVADLAAGMREQLHAMEHAAAGMREAIRRSPLDEFVGIANLLGDQTDLEAFLAEDPRATRILRDLARLERPLAAYREAFRESLRRLQEQNRSIRETTDAARRSNQI